MDEHRPDLRQLLTESDLASARRARSRHRSSRPLPTGAEILILSDRDICARQGSDRHSCLPWLRLFTDAAQRRLANRASIIVETGEARDVHQMACLIGYGASAVHPWLACSRPIAALCRTRAAAAAVRGSLPELREGARGRSPEGDCAHGHLHDGVLPRRPPVRQHLPEPGLRGRLFPAARRSRSRATACAEIEASLLARHRAGFGAAAHLA